MEKHVVFKAAFQERPDQPRYFRFVESNPYIGKMDETLEHTSIRGTYTVKTGGNLILSGSKNHILVYPNGSCKGFKEEKIGLLSKSYGNSENRVYVLPKGKFIAEKNEGVGNKCYYMPGAIIEEDPNGHNVELIPVTKISYETYINTSLVPNNINQVFKFKYEEKIYINDFQIGHGSATFIVKSGGELICCGACSHMLLYARCSDR